MRAHSTSREHTTAAAATALQPTSNQPTTPEYFSVQVSTVTHWHVSFGSIRFSFICNGLVCIFVFFVSLGHFGFVFSNFVLLGLVFLVPRQEIGWEERLRNDLFCVEWDAKPYSVVTRSCVVFFHRSAFCPCSLYYVV